MRSIALALVFLCVASTAEAGLLNKLAGWLLSPRPSSTTPQPWTTPELEGMMQRAEIEPAKVIREIDKKKLERTPLKGPFYAGIRQVACDRLLEGTTAPPADILRKLVQDAQDPAEIARILNAIIKNNWRWCSEEHEAVFQRGRARLAWFRERAKHQKAEALDLSTTLFTLITGAGAVLLKLKGVGM